MIGLVHARRLRARIQETTPQPRRHARLGALLSRSVRARRWGEIHAAQNADTLLQRCALCALGAAGLLASSTHGARAVAALPLGLIGGWRAGLALDARVSRATTVDVRRALPFALDRLTTCLLAGMSVERAIRVIAPATPGRLGDALKDGLAALDVGMTRARAYRRIADRAGIDEVRSLTAALIRAERFGTSLADTLVAQARELRSRTRAAAEAEARTAPVKLIFPLVFCFLPAFVLLTIAPIAISAIRTLSKA
jgi:tight adherence protein C